MRGRAVTRRVDLNLGTRCNLRCAFCYCRGSVADGSLKNNLSTGQAKRLLELYRRSGMEAVDFTGGEPTIRPDIARLAHHAARLGFRKVAMITNGVALADGCLTRRLVEAGVSDFLVSLHGPTPQIHDQATGVPGSFSRLCRAAENIASLGAAVRGNVVVTGANVSELRAIAALASRLGMRRLNFILYNPLRDARRSVRRHSPRYARAAPFLKDAVDSCGDLFEKLIVRYMPLCLMAGYEGCVHNVHQVHYDHDEWNYLVRLRLRSPPFVWLGALAFGSLLLPGPVRRALPRHELGHVAILEAHSRRSKVRPGACRRCRYRFICGGVWRKYVKAYGDRELEPVPGPILYDIVHFLDPATHGF